jgi:hypothetical protein
MKSFKNLSTTMPGANETPTTNEYINRRRVESIARNTCERYAPATPVPYQFDGHSLHRFLQRLQAANAIAQEVAALQ